jgi:predicted ribosomally synthesized peptide with SipW-like signal peptide
MIDYRLFLSGVVLLGALTGLIGDGTLASFRSTASASANSFTAGTVDIAHLPASALLTVSMMVPGETLTAPLSVTNSGSLSLRYALSSTVTNPDGKGLGGHLTLTIKRSVTSCTPAEFGATGTVVYGPDSPLGTLGSSHNMIGTPGAFPNGGRLLNSGAHESLCFQVKLAPTTATSYQGATTTATFDFAAQQT